MAKKIQDPNATITKLSITHHRATLKITFPDKFVLKYSCSYSSDRLNLERPVDSVAPAAGVLQKCLDYMTTYAFEGETNGQRLERLAETLKSCKNLQEVAALKK